MIRPPVTRFARLSAWAAAAGLFLTASPAMNEALPRPPLKPSEAIGLTSNGCAIVGLVGSDAAAVAKFRQETRGQEWRGPCRYGLAHGSGVLTFPQRGPTEPAAAYSTEFFYGRSRFGFFQSLGVETFSTRDGNQVMVTPGADFDNPVWATDQEAQAGRARTFLAIGFTSVTTYAGTCYIPGGDCGPLYQIFVSPEGALPETYNCPNKTSAAGCEHLWRQLAAPLLATYRELRRQYDAETPTWRAELTRLNAARDARFAALDATSGEAFTQSQASALAEAGKAERDFRAQLAGANAGRLFTLADEFEGAGDIDKARQTLRTLINRFPDHGLAVTAAQRLTALPQGQVSTGDCSAPAQEAQQAQALRASMSRIPRGNAVWQYEAVLASIERSAAAWSRCPTHPSSAIKLRNYRAAYVEAAQKCAMISPAGACTPNMH